MFSSDRARMRESFVLAWHKHLAGRPLTPLEAQIAEVVALHPEYHAQLADPDALHRDFTPEAGQANPFLHLAMHLGLREQVATDRPPGIRQALSSLQRRMRQPHAAEHVAMECLGDALRQARDRGVAPDENAYLQALRARARGGSRR